MYRYIFLFLPLFSLAQNVELNIKKLHKSFVEVKENTFMCKYEVSNYWYSTYLDSTDNERPDSTKWSSNDPTGVMKALYHNHENYQDHPVVNISRDEAKAFCQWLTDTYHQNEKRKYEKVVFRLPREEEWRDAAYAGLENKALFPFSKESNQLKDKKGRLKANFKFIHDSCIKEENGTIVNLCKDGETIWINAQNQDGSISISGAQSDLTVPVDAYEHNNKIYNLAGNVYEMTENSIVGGSYASTGYYLTKYAVPPDITGPHPEVGFRIVMEIIEK